VFYPLSRWIEERYAHRTITHSLAATVAIAVVSSPLALEVGWQVWAALPLAHLIACFSDTFTKEGVGLFYPYPERAIYGNNPNYRLRTGSRVEYWVLGFFVVLFIWLMNLQSAGGLILNFNQLLGLRDGVEQIYNRYGGNHHIWVKVRGNNTNELAKVNESLFLVGQLGKDFILQDPEGIYRTGEQIMVDHISAMLGSQARTTEQNIIFNDDDVVSLLNQVKQSNSDAVIYLSGKLEVDEPEEIQVNIDPGQFQFLVREGSRVTLEYCPIDQAIIFLEDQYAYGTITAKIVIPKPF
jgi:inner membrane protein